MDFLMPYNSFTNNNTYVKPMFYWNESAKCVRIGEHYIFIEQNIVLEKKELATHMVSDSFSFSSMIPQTASEWTHLGADAVSAIVSSIPGGQPFSMWFDVVHAVSYFIEAQHTENEAEKFSLYIGGAVTGVLAFGPPLLKNVGGAIVKKLTGNLIGRFFISLFKFVGKGGKYLITGKWLSQLVARLFFSKDYLGKKFANVIGKHESGTIFKMLNKIPFFKTVTDFVKNKFSVALSETSQILTKELGIYKMSLRKELPEALITTYSKLDTATKNLIDEKTFVEISMKKADDKFISKITAESLSKKGAGDILLIGKDLLTPDKIATFAAKVATENGVIISKEVAEQVAKAPWKKAIQTNLAKEAMDYAVKNKLGVIGAKQIPYEQLTKKAILRMPKNQLAKFIPSSVLKTLIKGGAKTGIRTVVKTTADDTYKDDKRSADENGASSSTHDADTENELRDNAADTGSNESENSKVNPSELVERFNTLKIGVVANYTEVGDISLEFVTPERTRDEDDESGKLVLSENNIFNTIDITATLTDYTESNALLSDLKAIGKKSETKETLRDREFKKWQRSETLSSPYIESEDNSRFEFYFVVRERAKISLFKKNHSQVLELPVLFQATKRLYVHEVNSSMFMIIKKINING
jgi:predicted  nucleic acid-binding Zn-ribbon protein